MAFDYAPESAKASLTSADWGLHRPQARPAAAPCRARYPRGGASGGAQMIARTSKLRWKFTVAPSMRYSAVMWVSHQTLRL